MEVLNGDPLACFRNKVEQSGRLIARGIKVHIPEREDDRLGGRRVRIADDKITGIRGSYAMPLLGILIIV